METGFEVVTAMTLRVQIFWYVLLRLGSFPTFL
jgi:hypothetical protein